MSFSRAGRGAWIFKERDQNVIARARIGGGGGCMMRCMMQAISETPLLYTDAGYEPHAGLTAPGQRLYIPISLMRTHNR